MSPPAGFRLCGREWKFEMPSLKNIWVNPKTKIIRDDGETSVIEVSGMICEWG